MQLSKLSAKAVAESVKNSGIMLPTETLDEFRYPLIKRSEPCSESGQYFWGIVLPTETLDEFRYPLINSIPC